MLVMLFGILLSFNVFADDVDGVKPLGSNPTEEQKQVIRDAASNSCIYRDYYDREECVLDYMVNHNLEEEPSCE